MVYIIENKEKHRKNKQTKEKKNILGKNKIIKLEKIGKQLK